MYRATRRESGRVVALKKSRVSLRAQRTLLQHEAAVLRLLCGHPAIPEVFAYGRVEHFEMISMQILRKNSSQLVDDIGPLRLANVLDVALQLVRLGAAARESDSDCNTDLCSRARSSPRNHTPRRQA